MGSIGPILLVATYPMLAMLARCGCERNTPPANYFGNFMDYNILDGSRDGFLVDVVGNITEVIIGEAAAPIY